MRLSPYRHEGRLLLDVQPLIPLPEASELTVRLRRRDIHTRAARSGTGGGTGADWTPYVITTPGGASEPLRKRRAVLALVHALAGAGVDGEAIAERVPQEKFRAVPGTLSGEELAAAFADVHQRPPQDLRRWFLDEPVHTGGRTWVLSKRWGSQTEAVLADLARLAPGFGFHAATSPDTSPDGDAGVEG